LTSIAQSVAPQRHASEQQRPAYQFGGHIVAASPSAVDGEAGVFHQTASLPAQFSNVFGKSCFGLQSHAAGAAHGDGADDPVADAGKQRAFTRLRVRVRGVVAAPAVTGLDQAACRQQFILLRGDQVFDAVGCAKGRHAGQVGCF